MFDTAEQAPSDWIAVPQEDGTVVRANLSFLGSNWKCIYGQGCCGLHPEDSKEYSPSRGCCTDGFYVTEKDELKDIKKHIEMLSDEDWDEEQRLYVEEHGWHKGTLKKGTYKSKVNNGACVFANRPDGSVGSTGKVGCAFLHLGNRLNDGASDITQNSDEHVSYMPFVCSLLPIKTKVSDEGDLTIDAWSVNKWAEDGVPFDEDGGMGSFTQWWCVDSPDAYVNDRMVIDTMEKEIRGLVDDETFDVIRRAVYNRAKLDPTLTNPMPASPDGRVVFPMISVVTVSDSIKGKTNHDTGE